MSHNQLLRGGQDSWKSSCGTPKKHLICLLKDLQCQLNVDVTFLSERLIMSNEDLFHILGPSIIRICCGMALKRCSQEDNHLELIDWIAVYLQDIIRYQLPLLHDDLSRFPYRETTVNSWFIASEDSENPEQSTNIINLDRNGKQEKLHSPQYGTKFPGGLLDRDHILLYHGTDHDSAQNIFKEGIDVTKSQKRPQDFSNGRGYYLNNKFHEAVQWGFLKSSRPAVLVYKVNNDIVEQYRVNSLNLCGEENREEWCAVVRQFRSGKPDLTFRDEMKRKTFVEGPMASVGRAFNLNLIMTREDSYQMCIISEDLASEFDEYLHSVIFYTKN